MYINKSYHVTWTVKVKYIIGIDVNIEYLSQDQDRRKVIDHETFVILNNELCIPTRAIMSLNFFFSCFVL